MAIKFNEDKYYTNSYYSKVGGVDGYDMGELELEVLKGLEFDAFVKKSMYTKYSRSLEAYSRISGGIMKEQKRTIVKSCNNADERSVLALIY